MTPFESTVGCLVLWGARAGVGLGYTMEAAAVRLAEDIAELRHAGGIPAHVRTVITVLPPQRMLEIRCPFRIEVITLAASSCDFRGS